MFDKTSTWASVWMQAYTAYYMPRATKLDENRCKFEAARFADEACAELMKRLDASEVVMRVRAELAGIDDPSGDYPEGSEEDYLADNIVSLRRIAETLLKELEGRKP